MSSNSNHGTTLLESVLRMPALSLIPPLILLLSLPILYYYISPKLLKLLFRVNMDSNLHSFHDAANNASTTSAHNIKATPTGTNTSSPSRESNKHRSQVNSERKRPREQHLEAHRTTQHLSFPSKQDPSQRGISQGSEQHRRNASENTTEANQSTQHARGLLPPHHSRSTSSNSFFFPEMHQAADSTDSIHQAFHQQQESTSSAPRQQHPTDLCSTAIHMPPATVSNSPPLKAPSNRHPQHATISPTSPNSRKNRHIRTASSHYQDSSNNTGALLSHPTAAATTSINTTTTTTSRRHFYKKNTNVHFRSARSLRRFHSRSYSNNLDERLASSSSHPETSKKSFPSYVSFVSRHSFFLSQTLSLSIFLFILLDVMFQDSKAVPLRLFIWKLYRILAMTYIALVMPLLLSWNILLKIMNRTHKKSSRTSSNASSNFTLNRRIKFLLFFTFSVLLYLFLVWSFVKMTNVFYWDGVLKRMEPAMDEKASADITSSSAFHVAESQSLDTSFTSHNDLIEPTDTDDITTGGGPQQASRLASAYHTIQSGYIIPLLHSLYALHEQLFERTILCGFILVAMLSGFSSSLATHKFILSFFLVSSSDLIRSQENLDTLEQKLERIDSTLMERMEKLDKLERDKSSAMAASSNSHTPPLQRVISSIANRVSSIFSRFAASKTTTLLPMTSPQKKRDSLIDHVSSEIESLSVLRENLIFDVQNAEEAREQLSFRRTWYGKLSFLFGMLLSLWCLIRIALSLFNIFFHRRRMLDRDPVISRVLDFVSQQTGFHGLASLHQYATLMIIFLVILFSIRGLLLNAHRLFRTIFLSMSTNLVIQLYSLLMAVYSLSLVMLFRIHLPKGNRQVLSSVLEAHHEQLFYSMFDVVFVISGAISFLVMCILNRTQRKYRHDSLQHEL